MTKIEIPSLNILIVEDEEKLLAEWARVIERHNMDIDNIGYEITISTSSTVEATLRTLKNGHFDAVIVDLGLKRDNNEINDDGNKIVETILNNHPVGVVIFTGQPQHAKVDFPKALVRVIDKSAGLPAVIEWLSENKSLFLGIKAAESVFRVETAKVFFSQIWNRWKYWTEGAETSGTDISTSVARHIMAHVHDSLLSADEDLAHPEEAYFVPPLKSRLDTGDIVEIENEKWIVVSPRCDLANPQKVDTILLAKCQDFTAEWEAANDKVRKKLIQHDGSPKQHFLFPLRDNSGRPHGPWMVQFHNIKSTSRDYAIENYPRCRFASLSPLYVPSLVERFGSYFSRIGTPGYSAA
jgi:CheY-like chemotaxis protein